MKQYKLYINGKWVNSSSSKTFKTYNPANKKPLAVFQEGTEKDVMKAIAAGEKAYIKWSSLPAPKRAQYLFVISNLLRENKERLAKLITLEMGKVLVEARGDVQEAIDIFEYMAGEGRRLFGHTTPSELPDKFCMTVRRPIGVVGIITPWNFPIALPAWKIAPALICGNSIIFKPSSDTPLCALELVKILEQAQLPSGIINFIPGPGSSVGSEIVKNPKIRAVSFTGSTITGKWITENAGVKKLGLELGGKNPIIIMDDANLDLAVDGIIWGAFGTTGQRCTATSRVIVHKKIKKKLEKRLLKRVRKLKLGSGLNPKTDIGPLINKAAVEKVTNYVNSGKEQGAKLLCGGSTPKIKGFFFNPTIFTNVKKDMNIAKEEIFGPVLSIIPVKDIDQAIEVANSVEYGLSSSIYTQDMKYAFKAINKIEAGITYINSSTIGSEVHLPFGGIKHTGNGTREAGIEGINEFSETKTVYVDYSDKLQKAQIDLYEK
ncbi:aldehyde dehydrogenase family protein [Candidatus Woesearchaeota archaeon]|nr:aldehyde dehydrogenase family protein [Candidatus Woesearchaeota archaeon]MBW3021653.1 aldehyde dehydrogenase family protein [Candidatus Woesearchaeota archaeon]